MKKYNIYSYQNDLLFTDEIIDNKIKVIENKDNYIHRTIVFNKINKKLKLILIDELLFFLKKKKEHILVIGLGSESHTSDSVGPNTIKHIKVNAHLENLGIKLNRTKVSALIPGVLGETGILTEQTIKSIVKEIKPDYVILIDSFVSNDINYLNHTIEINDCGIMPGIGIKGLSSCINKETINVPILVIGVTTSILIRLSNNDKNFISYLLSTKDIDEYVYNISKLIGECINIAINKSQNM